MASLTRSESLGGTSSTPTLISKQLPSSLQQVQKLGKPSVPAAPRIDYEPLYTALKAAIGDNWHLYVESLALFARGQLNQAEFSRRVDTFLCADPSLTHLHNQFIIAIRTNAGREPPEPGVAAFVSANDKPTALSKPVTGDAAEQRLKTEIMKLPARERHRLKTIQEDPADAFQSMMAEFHDARQIRPPDAVPASAGGYNKTNWELEISKRFAQPLFSESNEFPDAETIHKRMVPICYQEGLVGGCGTACSDLMTVAAETFVKDQLSDLLQKVRSNGANYIKTTRFRRRLEREEEAHERGELQRNAYGLLPAEVEVESRRKPFNRDDLRVAAYLGNSFLAQNRIINDRVLNAPFLEEDGDEDDEADVELALNAVNGVRTTNGVNGFKGVHGGDGVALEEMDWGWKSEVNPLDGELDAVLSMG